MARSMVPGVVFCSEGMGKRQVYDAMAGAEKVMRYEPYPHPQSLVPGPSKDAMPKLGVVQPHPNLDKMARGMPQSMGVMKAADAKEAAMYRQRTSFL